MQLSQRHSKPAASVGTAVCVLWHPCCLGYTVRSGAEDSDVRTEPRHRPADTIRCARLGPAGWPRASEREETVR